jgi:hypothetical protein
MRHGRNASLRVALLFTAGLLSTGAGADCSGEPSTAGRLTANGGEVYDSVTGLTWARCSVGMKWVEGQGCLGVATRMTWDEVNRTAWPDGWRLPAPEELETIVASNCRNPSLDPRMFPTTVPDWYWTNRRDASYCWYRHFCNDRDNDDDGNWYNTGAVRLVRGGRF